MDTADAIARLNAALEGRYHVEGQLGEGGTATVYLAVQSEPIRRQVALKVLRSGMDSERIVARFEAERQTLALMEHPSIAAVIDAGVTQDGRPFFVMELVRGERLTEFADHKRLTVRERVALFAQVCQAVQHAHQKGIVHRDLKPSNILVAEDQDRPLVKVIDFGIARAAAGTEDDGTRLTRVDELVGTPAYMSPEQFEGGAGDVDTRSDIYALGVVLYEVITGALPFESGSYTGFTALAAALAREPPTPSRRLAELPDTQDTVAELRCCDVRSLRAELAGDLDWIVLKAMAKEPERRYETANGLKLDLERYLGHEPIRARPPSVAYRTRKFVRRHRASTALGAVLVMALIAFGIMQTVQAGQIREARDVADARREQAEVLVDFMLGDLRAKLQPLGRLDLLDDVGQAAVGYFSTLPESEFSDGELLSRARALYQIGEVRIGEGRADEAVTALEESLRLVRALSERDPNDLDRQFELSQAQFWAGYAAFLARELDTAEEYLLGYRETTERLVSASPDNPTYRLEAGYAHSNIGSVREARGDLEGAVEAYRRTIETTAALVREHPDSTEWMGNLAESHNTLGVVYRKLGRYSESLEEHEAELALKDQVLERAPEHAYWRFRRAVTHFFIGRLRLVTGDVEGARAAYRSAVSTSDSMVAADPTNAAWRRNAASSYTELARTLAEAGSREQATEAFGRAKGHLVPLVEADSTAFDYRWLLGVVETFRARFLADNALSAEVLAATKEAERLLDGSPETDVTMAAAWVLNAVNQGRVLEALNREEEAGVARHDALARAQQLVQVVGVEARPVLAEAYLSLGRRDEAAEILGALWQSGYRDPALVTLARMHGLGP